jgi:hypothetical protein
VITWEEGALHRVRDRLVSRRTVVINQLRAFLLERGIVFRKGPANLRNQMPEILEDADQAQRLDSARFVAGGSSSSPTNAQILRPVVAMRPRFRERSTGWADRRRPRFVSYLSQE